jgi:uncharacterized protein (UPF0335 family)
MAKAKAKTKAKQQPSKRRATVTRAPRPGANTLEGRAQPYLTRVERLHEQLDKLRSDYMNACKPVREDVREVYAEAKDHDIPVMALKGLVKFRALERKQNEIAGDMDLDEQAAYQQLVDALGGLGIAAARAAGYDVEDEERDVRPRHMTQPDASANGDASGDASGEAPPAAPDGEATDEPRADEKELAQVGRGTPEAAPTSH